LRTVVSCIAAIGSLAVSRAADTDVAAWKAAHSAGVQAAGKTDLAAARQCFAAALDEARRSGSAEHAARTAIGYANTLTHEGRHQDAARLLEVAARLGAVDATVSPATLTAIKSGLQIAKSGSGTLDALEAGAIASARSAPTPDASARVAPTPDASARSLAGVAPTPDASARSAPTPDASARVAPTPDASARSLAGVAPTPDASARSAPTPDASARTPMTASAIGAFGVAWWSGKPAASSQAAPTPDASARTGQTLDELVGLVKELGK
jgi:hypothetical protein